MHLGQIDPEAEMSKRLIGSFIFT